VHIPLLTTKFPNLGFAGALNVDMNLAILGDPNFIADLLPIAFVSVLETLISAKIADHYTNTVFDRRKEMLCLGLSNIFCVFGGLPATAALARTRLNIISGCTYKFSALINSITILVISAFFFWAFKYLPMCILGASVVYVAIRIPDTHGIYLLLRAEKDQFYLIMGIAFLSILYDSTYGIAIGFFIYLIKFLEKFLTARYEVLACI